MLKVSFQVMDYSTLNHLAQNFSTVQPVVSSLHLSGAMVRFDRTDFRIHRQVLCVTYLDVKHVLSRWPRHSKGAQRYQYNKQQK